MTDVFALLLACAIETAGAEKADLARSLSQRSAQRITVLAAVSNEMSLGKGPFSQTSTNRSGGASDRMEGAGSRR